MNDVFFETLRLLEDKFLNLFDEYNQLEDIYSKQKFLEKENLLKEDFLRETLEFSEFIQIIEAVFSSDENTDVQELPFNFNLEKIELDGFLELDDVFFIAIIVSRFPFLEVIFFETDIFVREFKDDYLLAQYDKKKRIPNRNYKIWDVIPIEKRKIYFNTILQGRRPSDGLRVLHQYRLLELFLPEVTEGEGLSQNRFHNHDIMEHLLHSLDGAFECNLKIRWSALLHDIGKVKTRKLKSNGEATFYNHEWISSKMMVPIMKRLGIEKELGQEIKFLVKNHMFHYTNEWTDKAIRRFIKKISNDDLQNLIQLRMADRFGSGKSRDFPKALKTLIKHIDTVEEKEKAPKVTDLNIDGKILMANGFEPSKKMGDILKQLLREVVDEKLSNDEEKLLERALELKEL